MEEALARYPKEHKASAMLWLLWLAQEQGGGRLTPSAIQHVAEVLEVAPIRAHEVASFYTMFQHEPKGRWRVQVCRTSACWIRGSDEITRACLAAAGVEAMGEVSADGAVSVEEVECLGACANAPVFQVNDREYYEDLTPESAGSLVRALRALGEGEALPPGGSQTGRLASAPAEEQERAGRAGGGGGGGGAGGDANSAGGPRDAASAGQAEG